MATASVIFALTYLVLALQRVPRLHIGRPAGALLGAVAMVAFGVLPFDAARDAIDLDTILFLLGMMIVLAYLEVSGFFEVLERHVLRVARTPRQLLWVVVVSSGVLSALFMNDTICLMLTPVVLRVVLRVGHGEVAPKLSTNRSSHARRQGLAGVPAVGRGRPAGSLRRLRCGEPAAGRRACPPRSRAACPSAVRST